MTEKELKDSVKAPEGTYFFYGEEDYLKDHYIKQIRRAVITDESLADFNEFVFDDMSFSLAAFEDAPTALPLMTDKKLVVVKLSEYSKAEEEDADRLYELIKFVDTQNAMRIKTGQLNEILAAATLRVQPPTDKGKRLKIFYMTQASTRPPTFVCFCNRKELFHFSYQRYLENQIRSTFGLEGTPIRFVIRERGDTKGE